MSSMAFVISRLREFRDEREWSRFHTTKNLASAISIEAAELNELFLWKTDNEADNVAPDAVKDELADIFSYCLLLSDKYGFNIEEIVLEKIQKNEQRYPREKAKGNARKYTDHELDES